MSNEERSKLVFDIQVSAHSNPLPFPDKEELTHFFKDESHVDLLLTAGGKRSLQPVTKNDDHYAELVREWKEVCTTMEATPPSLENDNESNNSRIVSVRTAGIQFPGLVVSSVATIGANYMPEEAKHEFVLLRSDQDVDGAKLVVWIFQSLTGGGDNKNNKKQVIGGAKNSQQSITTATYSVLEEDERGKKGVILSTTTSFTITVQFPALLLKILPTTREKAEKSGSDAIAKTLKKDVADSMQAFEDAFLVEFPQY